MNPFVIYITIVGVYIGIQIFTARKRSVNEHLSKAPLPSVSDTDIVFHGHSLDYTQEELDLILEKRFCYYRDLEPGLKERFIQRLIDFINIKTFIIKEGEGFKEMPVLVSAAAIQLTFGLKEYLLPFYKYIRIYPEEYVAPHALKILAGNVSGCTITVAWNHVLQGYENSCDGINVGLHEMSHALYYHKQIVYKQQALKFNLSYEKLMAKAAHAYEKEKGGYVDLYSKYAESNLQEFWAESIELFFERPGDLVHQYPELYTSLCKLLKQDPLIKSTPVTIKKPAIHRLKLNI